MAANGSWLDCPYACYVICPRVHSYWRNGESSPHSKQFIPTSFQFRYSTTPCQDEFGAYWEQQESWEPYEFIVFSSMCSLCSPVSLKAVCRAPRVGSPFASSPFVTIKMVYHQILSQVFTELQVWLLLVNVSRSYVVEPMGWAFEIHIFRQWHLYLLYRTLGYVGTHG